MQSVSSHPKSLQVGRAFLSFANATSAQWHVSAFTLPSCVLLQALPHFQEAMQGMRASSLQLFL